MNLTQNPSCKWVLLISLLSFSVNGQETDNPISVSRSAISRCQNEQSALLRLDCYDNLFKPEQEKPAEAIIPAIKRSDTVEKAIKQEKQRSDSSPYLIVSQEESELSQQVVISTPAIGRPSPKPILLFSCKDNITRMQIAFFEHLQTEQSSVVITLKTNTGISFKSHWFVRDNGLSLESSRGLPGISEIQKILHADTLTIESENRMLNGISFQISELSKEIKPLRQACRW